MGNPATLLIAGISGTWLILAVSRYLSWGLTRRIGSETLIIMGTHQLVIYVLTALFPEMRGGNLLWGGVLLAAIAAFEIPAIYVLNRYFPVFLGKKRR